MIVVVGTNSTLGGNSILPLEISVAYKGPEVSSWERWPNRIHVNLRDRTDIWSWDKDHWTESFCVQPQPRPGQIWRQNSGQYYQQDKVIRSVSEHEVFFTDGSSWWWIPHFMERCEYMGLEAVK